VAEETLEKRARTVSASAGSSRRTIISDYSLPDRARHPT